MSMLVLIYESWKLNNFVSKYILSVKDCSWDAPWRLKLILSTCRNVTLKLIAVSILYDRNSNLKNLLYILSADFYSKNEIQFEWQHLGLSTDDQIKKLLADFDHELIMKQDFLCPCPDCVFGKWINLLDDEFKDINLFLWNVTWISDEFPCIIVKLKMKRFYIIYFLSYYIPSSLFVMVAYASFFWPPDVIPGRTVLVITSLLTLSSIYATGRSIILHYIQWIPFFIKYLIADQVFPVRVTSKPSIFGYFSQLLWVRWHFLNMQLSYSKWTGIFYPRIKQFFII